MVILAMPEHGQDARATLACAMAILAMPEHGQDARGTLLVTWPSWPCWSTGRMPVAPCL